MYRQVEWGRGATGPFHGQTRWIGCVQALFLVVRLPNNPAEEVGFTPFTGKLNRVTRVTRLEGPELGLEPNLFESRT